MFFCNKVFTSVVLKTNKACCWEIDTDMFYNMLYDTGLVEECSISSPLATEIL